jgi:hypothetical protein
MKFKEVVEMTLSTDVGTNPLHHKNTKKLFGGKLIRRRLGPEFGPFIDVRDKEK